MSPEELVFMIAVGMVGIPTVLCAIIWRKRCNWTALALVLTWVAARWIYEHTHKDITTELKVMMDFFVIAAMFIKDDLVSCAYRNRWHQFACMWHERTPWDKGVLVLYPPTWLLYSPLIGGQPQYWTLWGIGLLQLALAGHEALHLWQRARGHAPRADAHRDIPPRSFFAPALGEANVT